jgi:hypothetical protein
VFVKMPIAWSTIGIIALLASIAGLVFWIHQDGVKRGAEKAKLEPLTKSIAAGEKRITADAKVSAKARAVADSAHERAIPRAERYLETRRHVRELPATALAGTPKIVLTAMDAADSAVMALLSDSHARELVISADSTEKIALYLQLARQDSVIEIQKSQAHPKCGAKCGGAIAAGVAALIALLAR